MKMECPWNSKVSRHNFLPYAWTSPYTGSRLSQGYKQAGALPVFPGKVKSLGHWDKLEGSTDTNPEVMILGNFTVERQSILTRCRQRGIDTVYGEDGWFPHGQTCHADPLGFCWESSLTRMVFQELSVLQREQALGCRAWWKEKHGARQKLPDVAKKGPYVLWPLQLLRDKVNTYGLAVKRWTGFVEHFRQCLPPEINLLLKHHPVDREKKPRLEKIAARMKNVDFVPLGCALQPLIQNSVGVAGMNSTVLVESRLVYQKPTWCYADSWYTNHWEVLFRVDHRFKARELQNSQTLQDSTLIQTGRDEEYALWFMAQLIARQYLMKAILGDVGRFGRWFDRRTFANWKRYGEEIFDGSDIGPTNMG